MSIRNFAYISVHKEELFSKLAVSASMWLSQNSATTIVRERYGNTVGNFLVWTNSRGRARTKRHITVPYSRRYRIFMKTSNSFLLKVDMINSEEVRKFRWMTTIIMQQIKVASYAYILFSKLINILNKGAQICEDFRFTSKRVLNIS